MAKGKKKESALTPEEKLAQELVPAEKQPYRVPENWCWVRGSAIFKEMEIRKPAGEFFDYIDIDAIDNSMQVVTEPKHMAVKDAPSRASRAVHYGDTVFSLVRPYLKNIAFIDQSLKNCIASTGFYVCSPSSVAIPRYLYLLMTSSYVVEGLNKYMRGDNSPSIRKDDIELFAYPVPPLSEQQRIVDRIESMFAKLDEAKEKAQAVLDSFETRKAAILHKAFTGELTAKWREEHGVGMESWTDETLQSVCSMKITDGTHKTPTYCDADIGVPFISAKDVTGEAICWGKIKYIVPELHEELYTRLAPKLDDILLAKNGTTGVAAIVDIDKVFDIYVTLAVLRPDKSKILPRYLLRIVNSPVCKNQFDKHLTGIGVPNLHLRDIKEVVIQIPSLAEQATIIQVVDSIMKKEQQAKEAAEFVLEKIDLLKKSILARAFRGELGTNDPGEESAVELVKRVLQ